MAVTMQPFHLVPGITIQRNQRTVSDRISQEHPDPGAHLLVERVYADSAFVTILDGPFQGWCMVIPRQDITAEWFVAD